jgi:hypothetical protein
MIISWWLYNHDYIIFKSILALIFLAVDGVACRDSRCSVIVPSAGIGFSPAHEIAIDFNCLVTTFAIPYFPLILIIGVLGNAHKRDKMRIDK